MNFFVTLNLLNWMILLVNLQLECVGKGMIRFTNGSIKEPNFPKLNGNSVS